MQTVVLCQHACAGKPPCGSQGRPFRLAARAHAGKGRSGCGRGEAGEAPVILNFGNGYPHRAFDRALQAFVYVRRLDCQFLAWRSLLSSYLTRAAVADFKPP